MLTFPVESEPPSSEVEPTPMPKSRQSFPAASPVEPTASTCPDSVLPSMRIPQMVVPGSPPPPAMGRIEPPTPIAFAIVPKSQPDPPPGSSPVEVDRRISRLLEELRACLNEKNALAENLAFAQDRGTKHLDYGREGRRLFRAFQRARLGGGTSVEAIERASRAIDEWIALEP